MENPLNKIIEYIKQQIKNENYKEYTCYKNKDYKQRQIHHQNAECYRKIYNYIKYITKEIIKE